MIAQGGPLQGLGWLKVYMKMLELSLFCDIFTEWDEKDFNTYLKQKSAVDSLLYGLLKPLDKQLKDILS